MIVEIWHGPRQRIGHLGNAQGHFNVLGQVDGPSVRSASVVGLSSACSIKRAQNVAAGRDLGFVTKSFSAVKASKVSLMTIAASGLGVTSGSMK